jgi:hypothetical protein
MGSEQLLVTGVTRYPFDWLTRITHRNASVRVGEGELPARLITHSR